MAVRVTHVHVEVLLSGPLPLQMSTNGQYLHNYNAGDMAFVAAYDSFVGVTSENIQFNASYFLAGFEQHEGTGFQGNSEIEAYLQQENAIGSAKYTLEVWVPFTGQPTATYALNAFVVLDDLRDMRYDLNAYAAKDQVFQSQYDLDIYLIATGYMQGVYGVEVYTDLLMQLISTYDILSYQQVDAPVGLGTYDLNAWEARNQAAIATYALNVFQASTGYLDTDHQLEAFTALNQRYGFAYDLNTLAQLDGFGDSSFAIEVLQRADLKFIAGYDLLVYELLDGLHDAAYALNAYEQATGYGDTQYNLSVFVAATGFADATSLLEALAAQTGAFNGTYLLDTFQELFTWVVNHNTGAPSRYENYDFDAFAVIGQNYLGARGDGIYLLDGDDDAGTDIDAIATTANTDMDEPKLKRVTAAYLGLHSNGQVHLTVRTDQGIENGPYRLRQSPGIQVSERAKFKRGIRSRYWQLDMENTDGEDVRIDSLELETDIVTRRIKK